MNGRDIIMGLLLGAAIGVVAVLLIPFLTDGMLHEWIRDRIAALLPEKK